MARKRRFRFMAGFSRKQPAVLLLQVYRERGGDVFPLLSVPIERLGRRLRGAWRTAGFCVKSSLTSLTRSGSKFYARPALSELIGKPIVPLLLNFYLFFADRLQRELHHSVSFQQSCLSCKVEKMYAWINIVLHARSTSP